MSASLGSGVRFKKLSATLAAKGASDPDALAAYIGRKRYGSKGMAALSHGKSLANPDLGIYLAAGDSDSDDGTLTCPSCNYSGPAGKFGVSGASLQTQPGDLQTPAPSTSGVRDGVPLTVNGGKPAHALANSTRTALELATGTARRVPVHGPYDVGVRRTESGPVLYHRRGGNDIGSIRRNDDGTWTAVVGGKELQPHAQQRGALTEAVATYNKAVGAGTRPQQALQPEPVQTPLMAEYGIPAMRSAGFATPTVGASDGARMTTADAGSGSGGDDSTDSNGLNAKGQAIYKKLLAKGLKPGTALAFAKNSQKARPGQFAKA